MIYDYIRDHLQSEVQQARLDDIVFQQKKDNAIKPHSSLAKCLAHAIASGYYMNAAMKCVNESVYKLLPLPIANTTTVADIQLVHIHPQSAFAHLTPSEHLVYQDILQNQKLFIRHVSKVSEKMLQEYRTAYHALDPHYLSQDDELIARAKEKEQQAIEAAKQVVQEEEARKKRLRDLLEEEALEGQATTEEAAIKRSKLEHQSNNNGGKLSAVEQAKLRYLSRKK